MAPSWSLTAAVWLVLSAQTSRAVSLRQSLLCEAHTRLGVWYKDQDRLQGPKERDGVTLQITNKDVKCGENTVPVTFGTFDVDADPIDVFNVMADTSSEAQWDGLISSVTQLGDWQDESARGIAISYNAHPFSDREVFEWQVFDAKTSDDGKADYWVVFSTRSNAALHERKERQSGAVAAQDCLAAYRIQSKEGGTHVTFTSHVNSHPFLLPSSFVFNIMWGKTVDYINALRSRTKDLASQRQGTPALSVPDWLLQQEPKPSIEAPFSCDAPSQLFEVKPARELGLTTATSSLWWFVLLPGFTVFGALAAAGPGRRWYLAVVQQVALDEPRDELCAPLGLEARSDDIEVDSWMPGSAGGHLVADDDHVA